MYVNDLQRLVGSVTRGAETRAALRELWHGQQPQRPGFATDCVKLARDPALRLEPLRRQHGSPARRA